MPIASSSDAREAGQLAVHVVASLTGDEGKQRAHLDEGWAVGWQLGHSVAKSAIIHSMSCVASGAPSRTVELVEYALDVCLGLRLGALRTFNMCSRVVLPALSRPRNSSFACLLRRPRDARTSQTKQDTESDQ